MHCVLSCYLSYIVQLADIVQATLQCENQISDQTRPMQCDDSEHTISSCSFLVMLTQANSENCGPPLGNKFDLEVGQRSPSRSRHGTTGKVLSQGTHMPSIKALSVIVQKLWPRLKFLWQTDRGRDGRTEGQTDEWDLMSPRFRESGGQKALHRVIW